MKKTRIVLVTILAVVLSSQLALGWWAYGHRLIVRSVFGYMPKDTPKFFVKGSETIAFYSVDPDVSKNWNTPGLRSTETPEHYFDLEYFKDIKKLPKTRAGYIKYCQKNGVDPYKAGYLPYAINEWYERLVIAFAEHRKWPKNKAVQAKCLYVAGVLAHYAGDACQPLHTTIHYDGRSKKGKKSPKTGIHAKVDGLPEALGMKDTGSNKGPIEVPDVWSTIIGALATSHKQVDDVYKLEKKLPEAGKKPKGKVDPDVKHAARLWMHLSKRLLRTLYYTAWKRSVGVGLPKWHKNLTEQEVTSGADTPEAAFAAFQKAAREGDNAGLLAVLTADSKDTVVGGMVVHLCLPVLLVKDIGGKVRPEIRTLLDKYKLDVSKATKGTSFAVPAAMIKDKVGFMNDIMKLHQKMKRKHWLRVLADTKLSDVRADGDKATGKVSDSTGTRPGSVPVDFKKIKGKWFVHFRSPQRKHR
jgi:hypothetical protein